MISMPFDFTLIGGAKNVKQRCQSSKELETAWKDGMHEQNPMPGSRWEGEFRARFPRSAYCIRNDRLNRYRDDPC